MINYILLFYIIFINAYTDIRYGKVFNKNIVIPVGVHFIYAGITGGMAGIWSSTVGLFLPILCLFPLFILKMLPAGDIKLIGGIGSVFGLLFATHTFIYGFFLAAIYAVFVMLKNRILGQRLVFLYQYIKGIVITRKWSHYNDNYDAENKYQIPLAGFIGMGALIHLYLSYRGYLLL